MKTPTLTFRQRFSRTISLPPCSGRNLLTEINKALDEITLDVRDCLTYGFYDNNPSAHAENCLRQAAPARHHGRIVDMEFYISPNVQWAAEATVKHDVRVFITVETDFKTKRP